MIYVDRSKSTPPKHLLSELEQYKYDAEEYFSMPESKRAQSRFDFFNIDEMWDLKVALIEEFHGKCAYTESHLDPKNCTIIRHRPRNGAANLDGKSDRDHYWWLAYEWENLIPVLPECARAKSHYFPVPGSRATPSMTLKEAREFEHALLPDPSLPHPSKHLVFESNGEVFLSTELQNNQQEVLGILGINNSHLIEKRSQVLNLFRKVLSAHSIPNFDLLINHFSCRSEFLELKFQWLQRFLRGSTGSLRTLWEQELSATLKRNDFPTDRIRTLLESLAQPTPSKIAKEVDKGSSPPPKPTTIHTIRIQRIEILNFKCIEKLTLDLKQSNSSRTPSGLMILGENGSGKSTILQAVALALEEPANLVEHPFLKPGKVLRRGETKGYVRLHLLDQTEPVEVSFSRLKFSFNGPRNQLSFFLSAYGPHRIMPRYNDEDSEINLSDPISINNLWDPYESLVDAERWMLSLDQDRFDAFALALKDLLDLRSDGLIYRQKGKLYFNIGGDKQSLDDLSAGYKSIIATATDIIASYPIKGIDMQQATGIVMIDEIGAHLHPRWRMRIVSAYRRTFPGIQFLCTTHEPLCLRGTRQEEVVVLARADEKIERITDLPDLEEMRIDQILTSPIFGMQTTVDPEAERKFQDYYYLLAKRNRTLAEKRRTDELRKYLYRYGVLGTDRRSRAIYDLIDKELATQDPDKRETKISAKTRRKFRELWDNTEFDL